MDVNSPATIDEYIALKIEKLRKELEIFQKNIESRYPDESPHPYPVTYLDWDNLYDYWDIKFTVGSFYLIQRSLSYG